MEKGAEAGSRISKLVLLSLAGGADGCSSASETEEVLSPSSGAEGCSSASEDEELEGSAAARSAC